jgi:hypothetical protein
MSNIENAEKPRQSTDICAMCNHERRHHAHYDENGCWDSTDICSVCQCPEFLATPLKLPVEQIYITLDLRKPRFIAYADELEPGSLYHVSNSKEIALEFLKDDIYEKLDTMYGAQRSCAICGRKGCLNCDFSGLDFQIRRMVADLFEKAIDLTIIKDELAAPEIEEPAKPIEDDPAKPEEGK